MKAIIFDLDGTLANTEHRQHFIKPPCTACNGVGHFIRGPEDPAFEVTEVCELCSGTRYGKSDWNAFFQASVHDTVIEPVAELFRVLRAANHIWIFSGRSNIVEQETIAWLKAHDLVPDKLVMRVEGDFTADEVLKESWYHDLCAETGLEVACVFDDRAKVVSMWRRLGLVCCQVAPGDF